MSYKEFLEERVREDTGFGCMAIPIVGWIVAIIAFSITYPLMYLFMDKGCGCYSCKNFKQKLYSNKFPGKYTRKS